MFWNSVSIDVAFKRLLKVEFTLQKGLVGDIAPSPHPSLDFSCVLSPRYSDWIKLGRVMDSSQILTTIHEIIYVYVWHNHLPVEVHTFAKSVERYPRTSDYLHLVDTIHHQELRTFFVIH